MAKQILIMTDVEAQANDDGAKFAGRRRAETVAEVVTINSETLQANIKQFVQNINLAFGELPEDGKSKYCLDEIEMAIKINVEGQVVLLGSGGKVGGEGCLTLRLKRK